MFCQKLLEEPNDTIESIDKKMLKVTNATLSQYMKHIYPYRFVVFFKYVTFKIPLLIYILNVSLNNL